MESAVTGEHDLGVRVGEVALGLGFRDCTIGCCLALGRGSLGVITTVACGGLGVFGGPGAGFVFQGGLGLADFGQPGFAAP
jgi:hypothetical protein